MALLTIWRHHSESGKRSSICLLRQCGPNGTRAGGRSWYRYELCRGNLRDRKWGEVGIDPSLWFCWDRENLRRAGGNRLSSLRTGPELHEVKTLSGWIHWWGFRRWILSALPVQIWITSRWFLPEDGNLFLSRFGGRKDSGGRVFLLWTC